MFRRSAEQFLNQKSAHCVREVQRFSSLISQLIWRNIESGLNGVGKARNGLKLCEDGATAFRMPLDDPHTHTQKKCEKLSCDSLPLDPKGPLHSMSLERILQECILSSCSTGY